MKRRLAVLLLVGACHGKPASQAVTQESPIPAESTQLVTAIVPTWDATTAELQRYHRTRGGPWLADGASWTGVVGTGSAWGKGLHGDGPPAGHAGPIKHEGDGRSPAGVFELLGAYGYAPAEPARAPSASPGLPYQQLTDEVRCIDDGADPAYNTITSAPTTAASFEQMRRPDDLYKLVVEVGHNPHHTPGAGSCIFLHVWHDASHPTVGCTAMPEPALQSLITWLDRDARPTFVLLPHEELVAVAATWGLPL